MGSYCEKRGFALNTQDCPRCGNILRTLDAGCDYAKLNEVCACGLAVELPDVEVDGRFSGIEKFVRDDMGRLPVMPGEWPAGSSDFVIDQFKVRGRC